MANAAMRNRKLFRKDESLDRLAKTINVAQFVSFAPGPQMAQQYARVLGFEPNHKFKSVLEAITTLINTSSEHSINVRSFTPADPKSNEFLYGLGNIDEIQAAVTRLAEAGLHVIINETVDVKDGGVSGVAQGGTIEFAPDDTPRCVEKPGVASLPRPLGIRLLNKVYGLSLRLDIEANDRLEFSVHPKPRGWKGTHLLGWELEKVGRLAIRPTLQWPNRFSRVIGDKTFGLLLASEIGLPVPRSIVINRRIAPFSFGKATGSAERWIRTAPTEQVPGKFTTNHGWLDPFLLLAEEDPNGDQIASIISQDSIKAAFSGALIVGANNEQIVEGRQGEGEDFMQGTAPPEQLPKGILNDIHCLYQKAAKRLGPVRFEWVHDGRQAWIVQLHRGVTSTSSNVVVPGEPREWRSFLVSRGLEELRKELSSLDVAEGILLKGQVGLTSHIADVLRKAGRPARIST